MRICFLGDAGHINLLSYTKFLQRSGNVSVDILSFNDPCADMPEANIHKIQSLWHRTKLRYLTSIPALRRKLRELNPDLLVAYRLNSYGFMAVMSKFDPVVVVAQGSDIFYPHPSQFNDFLVRFVLRNASLAHTWAEHMVRRLLDLGALPETILTVPKGVDTDHFRNLKSIKRGTVPTIISTRQLRQSYNHQQLFEAVRIAKQTIPELQLHMCGDGEYKKELIEYARVLGITDSIEFKGYVSHDDLPRLLNQAHVYVSMQASDGVSASLLEAMACGVFPIATDIAANRLWIKNGRNGFLTPCNEPEKLADLIISAFKNGRLIAQASDINRDLIQQKASMAANAKIILSAYGSIAGRKSTHGFSHK